MRLWHSIRVGWFLAFRQIYRASLWSTSLIILVMMLTFLNIVFVNGILIGLVQGSSEAFRNRYSGDLIVKELPQKYYIQNTSGILASLNTNASVKAFSARYIKSGVLEANYRTKTNEADRQDEVGAPIVGIEPDLENQVTGLASSVKWGEYLTYGDEDGIILGNHLLAGYSNSTPSGDETLENVEIGSKVRLKINGYSYEMTVRGILDSKIQEVSRRAYVNANFLKKLTNRSDNNANEISVRLIQGANPKDLEKELILAGFDSSALIETWEEAQGSFFKDITNTFGMLGAVFGAIGLIVASITIFIVVFINAITRKKYIGILKGIGIHGLAIELSYIIQSLVYAILGSGLGFALVFGMMKPYFEKNPIDFPFSDGILAASLGGTMFRILLILLATLIAGYIPARIVIKGNTLDAILGR